MKRPKTLRAVKPNVGVRVAYRKRLEKELDEMQRSVSYWLEAAYRKEESRIVGDASPVHTILARFNRDARRWLKRWDTLAYWLGRRFIHQIQSASVHSREQAYKDAGFTVKFHPSRSMNTVTQALISWNVGLIKSIPRQYLEEVRGIVTNGVSMGRDLHYISEELGKRYAITQRRARMIARDQSDKATQAILRTFDDDMGVTEAIWVHLPGKYSSRPTHKAMNGTRFNLKEGLYDSAVKRNVLPGDLVNCRCSYRPIIPEFGA
ncbi:MAG: hypothetical protein J1E80_07960 [Desulfovibrionaceae bacterium]|nr:hypothetical protein [Desulfovibrionaceae bacterium]